MDRIVDVMVKDQGPSIYTKETVSGLTTEVIAYLMFPLWSRNIRRGNRLLQPKYYLTTTESFDSGQIRLSTPNLIFFFLV